MQTGMLFQSLLGGASAGDGYDIEQMHILLAEEISLPEFGRAWSLVARRHLALTSTFQWEAVPVPQQRANPDVVVPIETEEWRGLDAHQLDRRRDEFLVRDRARGFDLKRAPLMRVTVFRLDGKHSEVVWTVHHILLDGRSMAHVLADVFAAYTALQRGHNVPSTAPLRPFRDYVDWLGSRSRQASHHFFKELLRGKTVSTPLPLAEPAVRPLRGRGAGESIRVVDPAVRQAAHALAQRTQTTMGAVLHAAWAVVLSRLTGDPDVVFGTTRACRAGVSNGDFDKVVGLMMNTLPVRVRVDDHQSVADLLGQVRRQSLALRDHEHTPLVEIQAQGELPRGRHFSKRCSCSTTASSIKRSAGWTPDGARDAAPCTSNRLLRSPSPCSMATIWRSASSLRVSAFASRWSSESAGISWQPSSDWRIANKRNCGTSTSCRRRSAAASSSSGTTPLTLSPISSASTSSSSRGSKRNPTAVALECRGVEVTYAELEERSNRLAHALVARGAKPGAFVGICFSRGIPLVVALLAVAKTGAAYVPLDPDYPVDRLAFMLADVNAPIVVTEQRHKDLFAVTSRRRRWG